MNNTTTAPRPKTVTYRARVADVEYGVTLSVTTHHITLTRDHSGSLSAIVDGENVEYSYAEGLLNLSEAQKHTPELLEEVILTPTIGKQAARALHIELGRLGHKNHYALAAEVLGKTVASLADLTEEEAVEVRSYGYGVLGCATGSVAA